MSDEYPFREVMVAENGIYRLHGYCLDRPFTFPAHYHAIGELIGAEQGIRGTITLGGTVHNVARGAFFYVPPGTVHSMKLSSSVTLLYIVVFFEQKPFIDAVRGFSGAGEDETTTALRKPVVRVGRDAVPYINLLKDLGEVRAILGRAASSETPIANALSDISIIARLLAHILPENQSMIDMVGMESVRSVIDVIEQSFHQPLTLSDIASRCNKSRSHLCRLFRKHTGSGLWEYFTSVRIRNAQRMLRNRDVSVSETADACGFASQSYFTQVFTKAVGMSPKKWQKEIAAKETMLDAKDESRD